VQLQLPPIQTLLLFLPLLYIQGLPWLENGQNGDKIMWNLIAHRHGCEMLGIYNSVALQINLSANSAIAATWPIAMGSNVTDVGSGTLSVQSVTGTVSNTITSKGSGTGTITLREMFRLAAFFKLYNHKHYMHQEEHSNKLYHCY